MGAAIAGATGSRYGVGSAAVDVALGCMGFGTIRNAARLAKLARAADKAADAAEGAGSVSRIFSAKVLKRMADEPGAFHNFPQSVGREVLEQGQRTVISDSYAQYTMRGVVNGVEGTYEIGVRPSASGRNEVITHWFFRPDKK